ncbi:hypothetical protein C8A00DRAFT_35461 [Chaetomidium leptoderma]|uniref:Uncharacterized protein n=1 Tax=Chaetomidium leptoderma TaxID=669021 RepID=A0AAN6VKI4_9PEZI|nr:hypothetical protein C8A00DRAFT_35461 [Chaetomidium leptoderma]
MKKAWVSLLAADDSSRHWVQHSHIFYDDDLDQQPNGQVGLYVSDFLGLTGLLAAFRRPLTAELAAGTTRKPTIALIYERLRAIFRRASHMHSPTEFTTEVGNAEENPYDAERRVAEARNEERIEMERRMAAEIERRVAEGRLEAE